MTGSLVAAWPICWCLLEHIVILREAEAQQLLALGAAVEGAAGQE